jgi:hypothetical protein
MDHRVRIRVLPTHILFRSSNVEGNAQGGLEQRKAHGPPGRRDLSPSRTCGWTRRTAGTCEWRSRTSLPQALHVRFAQEHGFVGGWIMY